MGKHFNGITYFLGKCPKCGRVFWVNPLNSPALCECNNVLSVETFISFYMDSIIGRIEANEYVQGKCPSCGRNRLIDPEENYCECLGCKQLATSERFISCYNENLESNTNAVAHGEDSISFSPTNDADFIIVEGELKEYNGNDTHVSIPTRVRKIGSGAFRCKKVARVKIPDSVIEIGDLAFADCVNLTHIDIPWSVNNIANNAFCRCGLQTVSVDSRNSVYDSRDNCNAVFKSDSNTLVIGSEQMHIPFGTEGIGDLAFCGRRNITSITIPDSVTSIGKYAFSDCYDLLGISIPPKVTVIREYAFQGCDKLSRVSLPDGLKSIETLAFADCPELIEINIPNSVNHIGRLAFARSHKITHIDIPRNVNSIEEGAFGLSGLQSLTVDKDNIVFDSRDNCNAIIDSKSNMLISGCKNTVIPASVTKIGNYAFYCCSELTELNIPESITDIGKSAFSDCSSLKSISIPNSVFCIDEDSFRECKSLSRVLLPRSIKIIRKSAFSECSSLSKVSIPKGAEAIGEYVFFNCLNLKDVYIPDSVSLIGKEAFASCGSVTIHGSINSCAQKYAESNGIKFEVYTENTTRADIEYQFSIINKSAIGECDKCHKETEVYPAAITYAGRIKRMKLCKSCAVSVKKAVDEKNKKTVDEKNEKLENNTNMYNTDKWDLHSQDFDSLVEKCKAVSVIVIDFLKKLFKTIYNFICDYLEKKRLAKEEEQKEELRKEEEARARAQARSEQEDAYYRAIMLKAAQEKREEINRTIEYADQLKENK